MASRILVDQIIHADWSADPKKRWSASASKIGDRWHVSAPKRTSAADLVDLAVCSEDIGQRLLLGFDFPIGLPTAYATQTGFSHFREGISFFGSGEWSTFFDVADASSSISLRRPFYPHRSVKGVSRIELVMGLSVLSFDDLLRRCERKTSHRPAGCSMFWTLGSNQVGKAAISGWREVVQPALLQGARLWPFDGTLAHLSQNPGCVIAETYPGEAYHHVGILFRPGESKRRQADRSSKASSVSDWAYRNRVTLSEEAQSTVRAGFGAAKTGEDAFDAFVGLIGMIEVVDGRRPEGPMNSTDVQTWEGWILGHGG